MTAKQEVPDDDQEVIAPTFKHTKINNLVSKKDISSPPPMKPIDTIAAGAPGKKKPFNKLAWILSSAIVLVVLLLVAFAYIYVPFANASLLVKTQDFKKTVDLTIDGNAKAVAQSPLTIPGQLLTSEKDLTKHIRPLGPKMPGRRRPAL